MIDIDSVWARMDGAYDGEVVYDAVTNRHPNAEIIIPP